MADEGKILEFSPGVDAIDPEVVAAVEAALFAVGDVVKVSALASALDQDPGTIRECLRRIARRLQGGGIVLEQISGGWQLRTAPRFGPVVHRILGTRPARLSQAALEVLSVVAYRQPVTRSEVEALRGVDSGGVMKSLIDKGLLRTAGRSPDPGRPLLYRTTASFLELFSLPDLRALPTLKERESLVRAQTDEPG